MQIDHRWLRAGLYWLAPVLWMALIFFLSSQTYSQQDLRPLLKEKVPEQVIKEALSDVKVKYAGREISIEKKGVPGFLEFFIRKGAHIFVFAMLAIWIQLAVSRTWVRGKWGYVISFGLALLFAIVDEWYQSFNPGRTGMIEDVFVDGVGVVIGSVVMFLFDAWWGRYRRGVSVRVRNDL